MSTALVACQHLNRLYQVFLTLLHSHAFPSSSAGWAAGLERLVLLTKLAPPPLQLWAAVLPLGRARDGGGDSGNGMTAAHAAAAPPTAAETAALIVAAALREGGASAVVLRGCGSVKKAVAVRR